MKKLVASFALFALLTTPAFADQLQWLESQADAKDAASRIQPGMPYVNWISHNGPSAKLLVAKSATVRRVPNENYWEVVVEATPVAERRGDTWVAARGQDQSRAVDLAYVYLPQTRQTDGQRFRNVARSMGLEAMIEHEFIVVPTGPMNAAVRASDTVQNQPSTQEREQETPVAEQSSSDTGSGEWVAEWEDWDSDWSNSDWDDGVATAELPLSEDEQAKWEHLGDKAIEIIGKQISGLLQEWVDGGGQEDDLLNALQETQQTVEEPTQQGALGALDALEAPSSKTRTQSDERGSSEPVSRPQVNTTSQQVPTINPSKVIDRPLGE